MAVTFIQMMMPDAAIPHLDRLVATGLFGLDHDEACRELVLAGLRDAVANGLIPMSPADGVPPCTICADGADLEAGRRCAACERIGSVGRAPKCVHCGDGAKTDVVDIGETCPECGEVNLPF